MASRPLIDRRSTSLGKKILVAAVFAVLGWFFFVQFGDSITLQNLAAREDVLRSFQEQHPLFAYGAAFLIYVAVTGLSLPGAIVMTLTCGWFFGFWRGLLLVSFASTTGATVAFLFSRFLLRDAIQQRFGDRLATFKQSLEREGAFYLFMLRMIPAAPFFVINVVMGLTPIKSSTFWWVSQIGMLPGTAVYVYAGASVPHLSTLSETGARGILSPQLLGAFALLGITPLIVRTVARYGRAAVAVASSDALRGVVDGQASRSPDGTAISTEGSTTRDR